MPDPVLTMTTYENAAASFVVTFPEGFDLSAFASATWHARRGTPDNQTPGTIALNVSTANGLLAIDADPDVRTVTMTLGSADTDREDFPSGDYYGELVLTTAGGDNEFPVLVFWQHLPTTIDVTEEP